MNVRKVRAGVESRSAATATTLRRHASSNSRGRGGVLEHFPKRDCRSASPLKRAQAPRTMCFGGFRPVTRKQTATASWVRAYDQEFLRYKSGAQGP